MTALLVFTDCLYSQTACFGGRDTITELPQDRKDKLKKFYELHKLY